MSDACTQDASTTVVYTGTRRPSFSDPTLRIHHLPMLEVAAVDFDRKKVKILVRQPCTLVFYSTNSVKVVADSGVLDDIDLRHHTAWAVGEKTAATVRERLGIDASVPDDERFDGLVATFRQSPPSSPIIAFALKESPRDLARRLGRTDVHEVPVYHTCAKLYPRLRDELAEVDADWIAFTSPRGVRTFLSQASHVDLDAYKFAAIGPTTGDAMNEAGIEPALVMETPDKDLMMQKILQL
ncbi:uroporphyrinogen-III synthase [Persicimonas caeni]|uniref:Uroporphyrinogen-III synthase n=1 Tax=Persicimonas caeni TaxID=2292766 RepID=A0A4Y6Q133_PERCE|nr:uroporphyrinogen-III synthase [Persicimonas caeni]QDG54253.1 uroporphyrinogen-III synthase [Persicimonas caeni]QED35474.1 uroporphyrinogen-III synthase [Persicimonas caeni]